jgi:hypothetical protein
MKEFFQKLKTWQKWVLGFILFVVLVNVCSDEPTPEELKAQKAATVDDDAKKAKAAPSVGADKPEVVDNWNYSEDKDEMTGKKTYFAMCYSENKVFFEFPYDGGSSFTLGVRKSPSGTDVYLSVSKGQFLTSYDGSSMRVKFDDEPPVTYTYNGTSDGSSDVIFIGSKSRFISKLRKAKRVSLEPEFYQAGKQIVKFNVEGLKWQH